KIQWRWKSARRTCNIFRRETVPGRYSPRSKRRLGTGYQMGKKERGLSGRKQLFGCRCFSVGVPIFKYRQACGNGDCWQGNIGLVGTANRSNGGFWDSGNWAARSGGTIPGEDRG